MRQRKTITIDGSMLSDMHDFFDAIEHGFRISFPIGRNLDAFSDVLRGGFDYIDYEEPFDLVWLNSAESRRNFSYTETARYWSECGSQSPASTKRIDNARKEMGITLYDELLGIIRSHSHVKLSLR